MTITGDCLLRLAPLLHPPDRPCQSISESPRVALTCLRSSCLCCCSEPPWQLKNQVQTPPNGKLSSVKAPASLAHPFAGSIICSGDRCIECLQYGSSAQRCVGFRNWRRRFRSACTCTARTTSPVPQLTSSGLSKTTASTSPTW